MGWIKRIFGLQDEPPKPLRLQEQLGIVASSAEIKHIDIRRGESLIGYPSSNGMPLQTRYLFFGDNAYEAITPIRKLQGTEGVDFYQQVLREPVKGTTLLQRDGSLYSVISRNGMQHKPDSEVRRDFMEDLSRIDQVNLRINRNPFEINK